MLAFANRAIGKVGGILVVLMRAGEGLRYLLMRREGDLAETVRALNAAFSGKGGGRGNLAQGSLSATVADVCRHFGVSDR